MLKIELQEPNKNLRVTLYFVKNYAKNIQLKQKRAHLKTSNNKISQCLRFTQSGTYYNGHKTFSRSESRLTKQTSITLSDKLSTFFNMLVTISEIEQEQNGLSNLNGKLKLFKLYRIKNNVFFLTGVELI